MFLQEVQYIIMLFIYLNCINGSNTSSENNSLALTRHNSHKNELASQTIIYEDILIDAINFKRKREDHNLKGNVIYEDVLECKKLNCDIGINSQIDQFSERKSVIKCMIKNCIACNKYGNFHDTLFDKSKCIEEIILDEKEDNYKTKKSGNKILIVCMTNNCKRCEFPYQKQNTSCYMPPNKRQYTDANHVINKEKDNDSILEEVEMTDALDDICDNFTIAVNTSAEITEPGICALGKNDLGISIDANKTGANNCEVSQEHEPLLKVLSQHVYLKLMYHKLKIGRYQPKMLLNDFVIMIKAQTLLNNDFNKPSGEKQEIIDVSNDKNDQPVHDKTQKNTNDIINHAITTNTQIDNHSNDKKIINSNLQSNVMCINGFDIFIQLNKKMYFSFAGKKKSLVLKKFLKTSLSNDKSFGLAKKTILSLNNLLFRTDTMDLLKTIDTYNLTSYDTYCAKMIPIKSVRDVTLPVMGNKSDKKAKVSNRKNRIASFTVSKKFNKLSTKYVVLIETAETNAGAYKHFSEFLTKIVLQKHKIYHFFVLKPEYWKLQIFMPEFYFYIIWKLKSLNEKICLPDSLKLNMQTEIKHLCQVLTRFITLDWNEDNIKESRSNILSDVSSYRNFILTYLSKDYSKTSNYYIYASVLYSLYSSPINRPYQKPFDTFLILAFVIQSPDLSFINSAFIKVFLKNKKLSTFWSLLYNVNMRINKNKNEILVSIQLIVSFLAALKDDHNSIITNKCVLIPFRDNNVAIFNARSEKKTIAKIFNNVDMLSLLDDDIYELFNN